MTNNLWNYPADLWPRLAEMEARREQLSRDWPTFPIETRARRSKPSGLLELLGLLGLLGRRALNQSVGDLAPTSVGAYGGEDDEAHICRGENIRPAAC